MSKYSGRGNFTFELTGYDDKFMEIKTNGMNTSKFSHVSCGDSYTLAVSDNKHLFGWGDCD